MSSMHVRTLVSRMKMRFISKLQYVDQNNPTQDSSIYSSILYDKYMYLTKLYDRLPDLRQNFKKILYLSHPFESITKTITSSFIPQAESSSRTDGTPQAESLGHAKGMQMKITNAFMKMYECLMYLDKIDVLSKLFKSNALRMYDVAGAPGMFVLATEQYLRKYHPNVKLDWQASSLEKLDDNTALIDQYGLYSANPERYKSCDVMNSTDIANILKTCKGKFDLVTGDIGIYHDDSWDKLQEEVQHNLEYGQASFAVNLCNTGGAMYLKMYSLVTYPTLSLLNELTKYFENVYVCKPFTSRILNDECYILCTNRNGVDASAMLKGDVGVQKYINQSLLYSFESARLNTKYWILGLVQRIVKTKSNITLNEIRNNSMFELFYRELEELMKEFESL